MLWKKSKNTPRSSFSAVFLFLFSSTFTLLSFCPSSVSALGIVDGISLNYNQDPNASNYLFGDQNYHEQFNHSAEALWYIVPNALIHGTVSDWNLWRGFSFQTQQTIPANSLVSFSISYSVDNTLASSGFIADFTYNGVQFEDGRTLLYDSCLGTNLNQANKRTFECTYVFYNRYATTLIQTKGGLHIIEPGANLANSAQLTIVVGAPSAVQLTNDGLSSSDRTWLETVIGNSTDSSAVISKLNELKSAQQATTDAIEDNTSAIEDNTSAIEDQTDVINDFKDYVEDDTPPELSEDSTDALADSAGWLPAGPVDSILTLPITFMQQIVNVLTGSDNCAPVEVPLPTFMNSNQKVILPCMRPIINQMGFLAIYEVVGGVVAMFIIWDTLKWLYEFVDKTLTFRENNSSIWGGL